jgi:uncharacterized membrane protein
MTRSLIAYVTLMVAFGLLDFVWLGFMGPRLYKPALGDMLAASPRIGPAVAFYLLYLVGLLYFAVRPALTEGGWRMALLNGAVFGLVAYATYDLTNQATLRIWPVKVTILDIAWGTAASAAAATVSFVVTAWTNRAVG